jgi:hypothetical protein
MNLQLLFGHAGPLESWQNLKENKRQFYLLNLKEFCWYVAVLGTMEARKVYLQPKSQLHLSNKIYVRKKATKIILFMRHF